jgi:hypothetical protein
MRDPSINITFSKFLEISKDMLTEAQSEILFKRATKFQPTRVLIKSTKSKIAKIQTLTRDSDPELFNRILTSKRSQLQHKFLPIAKDGYEWSSICEFAADAEEYSILFDRGRNQGYIEYIEIGLKFIGKLYSLSKFKYYKSKIFELRSQKDVVINDPDTALTQSVYKYYCRRANIKDSADFYAVHAHNFVYTAQRITERGISYYKYLDAIFENYKAFGKVPEPTQLHTLNSYNLTLSIK